MTAYAAVFETEIMQPLRTAVAFTDVMLAAAKLRGDVREATKAQRRAAEVLRSDYETLLASEQRAERTRVDEQTHAAIDGSPGSVVANRVLLERAIRLLGDLSCGSLDRAGAELLLGTLVELERQR